MIVDSVDELKDIIIVHLLNKDPQNRPMSNTFISKRNSEKLTDFVAKEIGSKEAFLEAISQLIASPKKIVTGLNSMYLDKDDLMQIFFSAAKCPSKRGLVRDAVTQYFSQQHPFSAEEVYPGELFWCKAHGCHAEKNPGPNPFSLSRKNCEDFFSQSFQGSASSKTDGNRLAC